MESDSIDMDVDVNLTEHIHAHINTPLRDVENIYKHIRQNQSTRSRIEIDTALELDAVKKENHILGTNLHLPVYLHTYIHTYIHSYIHTYVASMIYYVLISYSFFPFHIISCHEAQRLAQFADTAQRVGEYEVIIGELKGKVTRMKVVYLYLCLRICLYLYLHVCMLTHIIYTHTYIYTYTLMHAYEGETKRKRTPVSEGF